MKNRTDRTDLSLAPWLRCCRLCAAGDERTGEQIVVHVLRSCFQPFEYITDEHTYQLNTSCSSLASLRTRSLYIHTPPHSVSSRSVMMLSSSALAVSTDAVSTDAVPDAYDSYVRTSDAGARRLCPRGPSRLYVIAHA